MGTTNGKKGLFKGGGFELLGIQMLTAICLSTWSFLTSLALLWVTKFYEFFFNEFKIIIFT